MAAVVVHQEQDRLRCEPAHNAKKLLNHMQKVRASDHALAWCKYTVSFGSSLLFFPKHLGFAAVPIKASGIFAVPLAFTHT